jgi:predicted ArsR family transcriptional regulator
MDPVDDLEQRLVGVAALDQPIRRDLYRLLSDRGEWITRDDASEALGLARSVAAFHLDKLAEAGVVDVSFERTGGRTGPGAGRPSKRYRCRGDEVAASVPDRRYDLAASLLAAAIAEATATGTPVADCVSVTARSAGERAGAASPAASGEAVVQLLARYGYEPEERQAGQIVLTNCPFHRLADEHRSLVCGMNLDFLAGLLAGAGPDLALDARLAPDAANCCVRIGLAR